MPVALEPLAARVAQYFSELDAAIHTLSHMQEGLTASLPSWVLSHRRITLGISSEHQLCAYKILPDPVLEEDEVTALDVSTDAQLNEIMAPWSINPLVLSKHSALEFGDISLINNDPYEPAKDLFRGTCGWCHQDSVQDRFSVEKAKQHALDYWCNAVSGFPPQNSFAENARQVFDKFRCLVRQKNYKERKIHRYINQHQALLLPSCKNCFFEHELLSEADKNQKADFILEMQSMFPALLIELESPSSRLLRKNGELTAEANHAREQIARWARLIEEIPKNSEGRMSFLKGPKERLIIMGRGSESESYNSRYTDTRIWTYDVLLQEAKQNWNRIISGQCRLLRIDDSPRFV